MEGYFIALVLNLLMMGGWIAYKEYTKSYYSMDVIQLCGVWLILSFIPVANTITGVVIFAVLCVVCAVKVFTITRDAAHGAAIKLNKRHKR